MKYKLTDLFHTALTAALNRMSSFNLNVLFIVYRSGFPPGLSPNSGIKYHSVAVLDYILASSNLELVRYHSQTIIIYMIPYMHSVAGINV